jgi:hypothetical protein
MGVGFLVGYEVFVFFQWRSKMKKLAILSILVMMLACVFVSCGKDKGEKDKTAKSTEVTGTNEKAEKSVTKGLDAIKPGSYVEYDNPGGAINKMKFFVDTWEGKECTIMETETKGSDMLSINQSWIDKSTGKAVLFVTKINGKVMRMDINKMPTTSITESKNPKFEAEIPPQAKKMGEDKYTTPTGKTVKVVKYKLEMPGGSMETWASDEVPFGTVKVMANGVASMSLRDFAFSGAQRAITKQEAENAKPFGLPGGMPMMPPTKGMPGGTR